MAEKRLNETQMRAFVENEVRKALMEEIPGSQSILNESINEALTENLTDEDLSWLNSLLGGDPEHPGIRGEAIIGGILGRFLAPVLTKLLNKIGIDADGPVGQIIIKAATTAGGTAIGQAIGNKRVAKRDARRAERQQQIGSGQASAQTAIA